MPLDICVCIAVGPSKGFQLPTQDNFDDVDSVANVYPHLHSISRAAQSALQHSFQGIMLVFKIMEVGCRVFQFCNAWKAPDMEHYFCAR
jgi:hypothetical protein